jgi:hypothetical protein
VDRDVTEISILEALSSGGDERISIDPATGTNRYHLNPLAFEGLLQRGSCTAGTLNERSFGVAKAFLAKYETLNYESQVESQASRLRALVQSEANQPVDVFFAPSGTDLSYYPLMFRMMLQPGVPIIHLMSCPEELGSGSSSAGAGRYYSKVNQFGDRLSPGELVCPGAEPTVITVGARGASGEILQRRPAINRIVAEHPGASMVGSLVFGSKSGITDDLGVINDNPADIMWVVDLCQFRVDPVLIHGLLDQGAMVMLTGSKFFEAPPFAAALLVPRIWTEQLRAASTHAVAGFSNLFSAYDVPWALENLRRVLPCRPNLGLRLRWEIALDEMEAYAYWPTVATNEMIVEWNTRVTARLTSSDTFRLMPDQARTNPSIISFQVRSDDRELGHDDLIKLHQAVVAAEHEGLSGDLSRVFIGQPVRYGDRSFIRIALGAPSVRALLEKGAGDLPDDMRLVEIIEEHVEGLFS